MSIKIIKPGPPINESAIEKLEQELSKSLPDEYRAFILEYNGGEPDTNIFPVDQLGEEGVIGFFGIRGSGKNGDVLGERIRMAERVPSLFLPIAEAEGGNLVCLSLREKDYGAVWFWDHEEEAEEGAEPTYRNLYVISDSFKKFWGSLQQFDPSQVELKEGQVEEAWIAPEFLKELEGGS